MKKRGSIESKYKGRRRRGGRRGPTEVERGELKDWGRRRRDERILLSQAGEISSEYTNIRERERERWREGGESRKDKGRI